MHPTRTTLPRSLAPREVSRAVCLVLVLVLVSGCGAADHGSAAAAGSTGRADPSGIPVGRSTETLAIAGAARTFHLFRPVTLPDPAPLVVMLHGGFGTGTQAENNYGWDTQADSAGFLVAYPDGLDRAWNTGGGCCGQPERNNVDDVAFLSAMVAAVEHQVPVDTHRVYAAGISNGGIMAYTLACHTTLFAAIGPDSATQLGDCADPAPVSVLHIHGTADRNIPYNGGVGSEGVAHIDGPSAPALDASWRAADHCGPPSVTTAAAVVTSVATCPAGRAVELVTIAGAGHQWPGATRNKLAGRLLHTDEPSTALDATEVMWRFFAQHGS
jgi:polyhydroxybutyrate depolymerase